jgi:trk system potassium uptake protein
VNYRYVLHQLALLFLVLSAIMLLMAGGFFGTFILIGGPEVDPDARRALLIIGGLGLLLSGLLYLVTRRRPTQGEPVRPDLGRREAILLVALSWFLGPAYGALPYWLWASLHIPRAEPHPFHSYVDCLFESVSGFSTTGATILTDIGSLPPSLLLWRAITHWLGGLGIIVLFVAVLPQLGVGAKKLFRIETPGPQPKGLRPHIRETARVLVYVYITLTVTAILALRLTGAMGWFDAVCTAFSMLATGGLKTYDASVGAFDSVSVDVVCMVFMVLAGVNFGMFYALVMRNYRRVWKDAELRVYIVLKITVLAVVAFNLWGHDIVMTTGRVIEDSSFGQALRFGAFQTISLHTGTGFATADYDPWPYLSRMLLVGLMFIGGCAGSTAGGLKVVRFWMLLKILAAELEKTFRPNVVRPIKVGEAMMDQDLKFGAVVYTVSFALLFLLGAGFIMLFEPAGSPGDAATAFSASLATLANVGPGLYGVGATQSYAWFSAPSKLVMCLLMLLGRLEIFTIIALATPRFWKTT